ncbi:hypothetical protein [Streptomyces sp. NPDC057682]|uniref:hypothetical protein n=1 Tax=Streptomyces sp. NPDC057682 TaxID=3346210 RepID=UPI0036B4AEB5
MPAVPGRLRAVCLAAAVAAVLTGCSSSDDGSGTGSGTGSGEPSVAETPRMTLTAGTELPLDAYERSEDDVYALAKAQNVLTEQCMKRYGLAYDAPDPSPPAHIRPNARIFGLVDAGEAARYGYGSVARTGPAPTKPKSAVLGETAKSVLFGPKTKKSGKALAEMPMSQTAAEKKKSGLVVNGSPVPVGGCLRESYLKLYAPTSSSVDIMYVFNLKGEAESRALSDSRVKKATKAWSACMKKAGYVTAAPASAARDLGFSGGAATGPGAVTAAKADVACKAEVNYAGIRFAVQSAYEKRSADRNAETLGLLREQAQDRLRLASQLTS